MFKTIDSITKLTKTDSLTKISSSTPPFLFDSFENSDTNISIHYCFVYKISKSYVPYGSRNEQAWVQRSRDRSMSEKKAA